LHILHNRLKRAIDHIFHLRSDDALEYFFTEDLLQLTRKGVLSHHVAGDAIVCGVDAFGN
jgi:hypothetical protein